MEQGAWVLIAAMLGGFCAGVINAWAWLWPMSPAQRDKFLDGTRRAFQPWAWKR